jgi:hypothetical protein
VGQCEQQRFLVFNQRTLEAVAVAIDVIVTFSG